MHKKEKTFNSPRNLQAWSDQYALHTSNNVEQSLASGYNI